MNPHVKHIFGTISDVLLAIVILLAIAFPFIVHLKINRWLAELAQNDPIPDQGAMAMGFVGYIMSAILSIGAIAVCVYLWKLRKR